MNKFNCRHNWEIVRDYFQENGIEKSSLIQCQKCKITLTTHEAAEIELWKNVTGVQKWLSIGAFLIALASLTVAFLK